MMGKVVDHGYAVDLGLHFQAPLHAAEAAQGLADGCAIDAVAGGKRGGGSGVQDVVLARQRKLELGPGLSVALHAPARSLRLIAHIANSPGGILAEAIALDRAESAADTLADAAAASASPIESRAALLVPGDDAARGAEPGSPAA